MHQHTLGFCFSVLLLLQLVAGQVDYGTALTKSLLYYEAQRSGKLPATQRVTWRGESGLEDGSDVGVDLTGGYYDAGDNMKFGFPMAFTVTMLSWSVVEYESQLSAKSELSNALDAIKWGTDYFIKAYNRTFDVLYGQVGEGQADHDCWQRPEDMNTPRTAYKIDAQNPGSDLAGETSAALAAASIAFKTSNPAYSSVLLASAKQLFELARNHPGVYHFSIPARPFYTSNGFQDELLWAAAWLYRATEEQTYMDYLESADTGGVHLTFCWDDKYVGAHVLMAKLVLEGKLESVQGDEYKSNAEEFVCSVIQKGNNNVQKSKGGLLFWQPWNNLQYVTTAIFVTTVYSDYLTSTDNFLDCPSGESIDPEELIGFVKSQVDYILGSNPKNMSYMVGMGTNYPVKVHHRGASIVSIRKDPTLVTCKGGYYWRDNDEANPNVLEGALVGGPGLTDEYDDSRNNFPQSEPATVNTAPFVGVLARLA